MSYTAFEHETRDEVLELVKEHGSPSDMEDSQNDAPSMRDMLELASTTPTITYHGYIIGKPRVDYRVTLSGFYIPSLTADELLSWIDMHRMADECSWEKNTDGTYNFRTWWD